jgi:predicted glycoside hydrolase/deacetylase ChbG (UPF0249 family)
LKKLIVTADDVGLHPGMTLGALAAHDDGIVTAVSVSANGRALDHAVERLLDRPGLDIGIHLTLVGERPLSTPEAIPSLLGKDGALLPGFQVFAARYFLGGIKKAEVEAELRRQIERLLAAGLRIVHANSHQHLHVLPRVLDVVLGLGEEYRIPFVRLPWDPQVRTRWSLRTAQLRVLNHFGRRARRRRGVRAPDRTIGLIDAGHLTVERLSRALAHAEGITELVCHPGLGNAELVAEYDWSYDWDQETAALRDPRLPGLLQQAGVELTSFTSSPLR